MSDRTILIIIMLILHTAFFYLYYFQAYRYSKQILKNFKRTTASIVLSATLLNLIIFYCVYLQIPLLILYIVAFLFFYLDFKLFSQSTGYTVLFGAIMFAAHLSLIHLIVFGSMGLYFSITPIMLKANFLLYLSTYTIGWIVACIFLYVFQKLIAIADVIILTERQYQIKSFDAIGLVILAYIYFDGYIMFDEDLSVIINLYLVISSLSVGIFFYLYILHSLKIAKASAYKQNYASLLFKMKEKESETVKLSKLAYSDTLTGVYNRVYINEEIQNLMKQNTLFSIAYIDFDRLKHVNDTLGHQLGDGYIQFIVQILKDSIRSEDKLGRIGGDEFVLVMPFCVTENAEKIVCRITEKLSNQIFHQIVPSISYGVACYDPNMPIDFDKLVQLADEKMYLYKKENRKI